LLIDSAAAPIDTGEAGRDLNGGAVPASKLCVAQTASMRAAEREALIEAFADLFTAVLQGESQITAKSPRSFNRE
jgi:hypothetical protein